MATKSRKISHEEIQEALRAFQEAGGLVTRLSDEETPLRDLVGAHFAAFEQVLVDVQVV